MSNRSLVLVIAGLDSGGGAGITADMLTIHDCGAWGLPCVTALTAQSLKNVTKIQETTLSQFRETLRLAKQDWEKISAAKIGLITHREILEETLQFLENSDYNIPVVWDPVLTATAGRLESADLKSALTRILKVCTVFTPNLPEALELAGWNKEQLEQQGIRKLGQFFIEKGVKSVIIKGGHLTSADEAVDTFVSAESVFTMTTSKTKGDGAHGGGCAFSSAIAAFIASGYSLHESSIMAKAYVYNGIVNPALPYNKERPPVGHNGIPDKKSYMPRIQELNQKIESGAEKEFATYLWKKRLVEEKKD